ncbi:MAG: [Fe-Fe] hydrogenase large subunit C-terminal domain-containing protein [Clostridium sp.]
MIDKYKSIFKELVLSYDQNNFHEKLEQLKSTTDLNEEDFTKLISSLCGVEISPSPNYKEDLKDAISNYSNKTKIVSKIHSCATDCIPSPNTELSNCQSSCPFDAILYDKKTKNTYINKDACTDCGFCVDACKHGNILDKIEFMPLLELIHQNKTVIAAVAPAISGQFGDTVTMDQMRTSFKKLGFTDMVEVAFFADMLTLKEAFEFNHHIKTEEDLIITSCCCPMWVGMLKRIYGDLVKHVTPSVSPMIAAGRVMKYLNPDCKVVFIGPCVAKKAEAREKDLIGDIDFVLTFQELKEIFDVLNITPSKLPEDRSIDYASKGGRLYARTGGVSIAVKDAIERLFPEKSILLKAVQGNGVKECKDLLSKAQLKELNANFIEGMGCIGGCVGGPKKIITTEEGKEKVDNFANASSIKVAIDSPCMMDFLNKLGINSIKDFASHEKLIIFNRNF